MVLARFSAAISNFLVTAKNTTDPGWSSVATAGTSMGDQSGTTTTAFALSLYIVTNIQPTILKGWNM